MNFLLKIAEGPMKGAEVALQEGTRLRVGSSPDCDIVLNDVSLAAEAFQLDVSESVVTLIGADGTQTQLKPFEIHDFGTTAIAVGPLDQPWSELVRPVPEAVEEPKAEQPAEPAESAISDVPAEGSGKHRFPGCLVALVLIILLLLAGAFWIVRSGRADEYRERVTAWSKQLFERWNDRAQPVAEIPAAISLKDIAVQYRLTLGAEGRIAVLSGNLRRRTERLAIRALALAADPSCILRLTDDETMLKASDELLFAYTDGTIKAVAATNGIVTIVGHAPDAAALERALRTLDAEVKGIERVDASGVTVGGKPVVQKGTTEKAPFVCEQIDAAPIAVPPAKKPARDYPIAGILTAPYPCVVMRDGQRVMEGALIGTAVLVKIEADRLRMRDGGTEFEWRP